MIWAKLDIDILDDPAFCTLYDADPGHPWRFLRMVQIAKRFNCKGLVCRADGIPVESISLARVHDGKGEGGKRWDRFLDLAEKLDLLIRDEETGAWKIVNWRRWHCSPSDGPESTRERKRRSRVEDVTTCHETSQHVTDVTTQSRAEHSMIPPTPQGESGDTEFLAIRLDALKRLPEKLGKELNSKEKRAATRFLSRKPPDSMPEKAWHKRLFETFSLQLRTALEEAASGKPRGSVVLIALSRAEEQIAGIGYRDTG